ncbi:MAG: Ig-like domain-containing protein [Candidatus Nanosyncoccaceae bacterium]|jgi:hypothetical protein
MVGKRRISKLKLLSIISAIALFGAIASYQVWAGDVNINMEVCTETNTEPSVTLNYANDSTVFVSPISLNFLTDWVYQATTRRGATQLAQSTVQFEAGQSFSQSINLVPGSNTLTITINGGCPRHDVIHTLNLFYDPNDISVNHQITPNPSPAITGQVGINDHRIEVTVDGTTYTATNHGNGTWTLPAGTIQPLLPNGTYDVQVQLINASNVVINTINEIGALVINRAAPTVTINPLVTNQSSPELTGEISSPDSIVEVTVNGTTYTVTNNGDGTWTLPAGTIQPDLADGDYDIIVEAIHPTTHAVEASTALTPGLTVDTIAPQVTVDETETDSRQPEVTGTTDDPTAIITVEINGHTYTATNNGDGTWTLPEGVISALASGEYDMVVTATDGAGNSTVLNVVFTVDAEDEFGFILPPKTGYIRINRTNIPSWLLYLILIALITSVVRISKRRRLAKTKVEV